MAAPVMNIAEALAEAPIKSKMDGTQVNVTEIQPEDSPVEVDRLTIHSPTPRLNSGIQSPRLIINEPTDLGYDSPDICRLPPAPRVASPTGSVRSSFTSRRRVSRYSSHWSRSSHSHHAELSRELTRQAESEFFALMELMTSVSRRSMSLKEVWTKIISERESHCSEMESMYERIEEFTQIIERHEKEKNHHNHEHEERKKLVLKLELDLKAALEVSAGYKKKLQDRDGQIEKYRGEISEYQDKYKYIEEKHEKTVSTLEETQITLLACEARCRQAEGDAEKHHAELRSLKQKYSLLQSSSTEITTKYESTHKELVSIRQTLAALKKEKHDWCHAKDDLDDELRKCHHHEKELKKKIIELTESYEKKISEHKESYEKKKREVTELTETVTKVKHQREELHTEIKVLKTKLEEWEHKCHKAEDDCRHHKRRYNECDLELIALREEFSLLQSTHDELKISITKKTEELRSLQVELDDLREEHHGKCKSEADCRRQILVLQETIHHHEKTISEKTEMIHTMSERIERIERERDDACRGRDDARAELATASSALVSLKISFEASVAEHNTACEKLRECEKRYESVCERMTEFHESGGEWEEEIEHLHEQLRECKEQKEKAISLRKEADRERDESVSRYEAKCREVERLEERIARGQHSHGGRVRKWATSSTYSRSVIGEEDEVRSQDLTL